MAKGTQAAKVGLFVTLTGAAAYGLFRFVSPQMGAGSGYTVHAYIHDATGLAINRSTNRDSISVTGSMPTLMAIAARNTCTTGSE